MKSIRTAMALLALSIVVTGASAQDRTITPPLIPQEEWTPLFTALNANDWKTASELSGGYLARFERDTLDQAARLRYMYILSSAGMVADQLLSYDELHKRIDRFVGEPLVFPGHPIAEEGGGFFNQVGVSPNSDSVAMVIASNAEGTSILCFEYVELSEALDIASLKGEVARLSGVLRKIEYNPNGSTIWILRLYLKNGEIGFLERR